jgi:Formate/nitrite family of transporters
LNQFILGILAGAFIAFASEGSNMAAFNLFAKPETYGLGKALAGVVFATGLMLVIIAGGELFTGNTLITIGVLEEKIKLKDMLSNLVFCISWKFCRSFIYSLHDEHVWSF